jgi:hypothetical protein
VGTSTKEARASAVWQWTGRAVACIFFLLGSLVFVTFLDTSSLVWLALAITGVAGALLYLVGLEGTRHPSSRCLQIAGWVMMATFSLIPTSLLITPLVLVLFALPALLPRFQNS